MRHHAAQRDVYRAGSGVTYKAIFRQTSSDIVRRGGRTSAQAYCGYPRDKGDNEALQGGHTSQIVQPVRDAIFGNVGTMVIFRIGVQDAPLLARQLGLINPADLIGLPNYRMFVRLMISGAQAKAFTAQTRMFVIL
jgi:hypothetical protein